MVLDAILDPSLVDLMKEVQWKALEKSHGVVVLALRFYHTTKSITNCEIIYLFIFKLSGIVFTQKMSNVQHLI